MHSILKPPSLRYFLDVLVCYSYFYFFIYRSGQIFYLFLNQFENFFYISKNLFVTLYYLISCQVNYHIIVFLCVLFQIYLHIPYWYVCVCSYPSVHHVCAVPEGIRRGSLKLELQISCIPPWDAGN